MITWCGTHAGHFTWPGLVMARSHEQRWGSWELSIVALITGSFLCAKWGTCAQLMHVGGVAPLAAHIPVCFHPSSNFHVNHGCYIQLIITTPQIPASVMVKGALSYLVTRVTCWIRDNSSCAKMVWQNWEGIPLSKLQQLISSVAIYSIYWLIVVWPLCCMFWILTPEV